MGFAEDDPNLIAFIDYYGEYWMEGMNGLTLDDWNVYSVDDHRTSSHVNSMHRVLTSLIEPHPNIWSFIGNLKYFWVNCTLDEATYRSIGAAPSKRPSAALIMKEELLAAAKVTYQRKEITAVEYLMIVAAQF